jgi:hypothetical protein
MQRRTLTADESEFVGGLCHFVRAHLASFKSAGQRLDAKFSAAAFRQRHEALADAMREARALRFDEQLGRQVPTDEPMYGEWAIAEARKGTVPERVGERMARALGEVGNVETDDALDTSVAEEVCVLTWLAWDEHAHLLSPRICEFQSMDWNFDPLHTDCNRRQLHKEHVSPAWVSLARKSLSLVRLRPTTPALPPHSGHATLMTNAPSAHPPAELWLRDRAPVVRAQLERLAPDIAKEETQLRRLWKAQRMTRVRAARDELRQHLKFHPESLPEPGKRWTYFREQLRRAHDGPTNAVDASVWSIQEAIERGNSLYAQLPLDPSFAAWVQFLMIVVFDARADEPQRISPLQELSNDWPGRPALQLQLRHIGLLDPLLRLSERAWVVIAQMRDPRAATSAEPESPTAASPSARFVVDPDSLRPDDVAALEVLLAERDGAKPLSSNTLAERITNRHKVTISDSDVRKYVIPKLKPLLHSKTTRGYRILSSMRSEAARILEAARAR